MRVLITIMMGLMLFACATSPAAASNGENTSALLGLAADLMDGSDTVDASNGYDETNSAITGPVYSADKTPELANVIAGVVSLLMAKHPIGSSIVALLVALMPLLQILANWTKNPRDNAALILINKILQTITLTPSQNQLGVLPWSTMLKVPPSKWPDLIKDTDVIKSLKI